MHILGIDSETRLITPGCGAPPLVCVSHFDGTTRGLLDRFEGIRYWRHVLSDLSIDRIVGHNVVYDLGVACAFDESDFGRSPSDIDEPLIDLVFAALDAGRIACTMIRELLLDIAKGTLGWHVENGRNARKAYSLEQISNLRLGKQLDKGEDSWRTRYRELEDVPIAEWPERAKTYAIDDAVICREVYLAQEKDAGGAIPDEPAQMRAAFALHLMGLWGVRTDGEEVERLSKRLQAEIGEVRTKLKDAGVFRPTGAKNMAAIEAMVIAAYGKKGLSYPKTPGGKPSTSAECLQESGDPVLEELSDLGGPSKIFKQWVPALSQGTIVPINARWQVLVETGRTSCKKPSWQNPHRKGGVRECVRSRESWLLASNDFDMAELRGLAQVCLWLFGKSEMADALRAGRDLHLDMAAQILGISYEEALRRKKEPLVKDMRQLSKAINFGLPGGLGIDSFVEFAWSSYGLEIPVGKREEWEEVPVSDACPDGVRKKIVTSEYEDGKLTAWGAKKKWMARWTEMRPYFDHCSALTGMEGSATVRFFKSGRYRGDCAYTVVCNGFFQALIADLAKAACYAVARECYTGDVLMSLTVENGEQKWVWQKATPTVRSPLAGSRPILFLHDEIILETPENGGETAAALRLSQVMNLCGQAYIPDIPVTSTPALMRRWHKGCEAVWLDGRMVPWEPHVVVRCPCGGSGDARPDCLPCKGSGKICEVCGELSEPHCWGGPKPEGAGKKAA